MIRIFKLLFLLVISQVAFAQAPSNYTNINGRYRWIAGMFDSTFHIPKGSTPSLRTGGSTNAGGLFYNTSDSSVYTYTGTQWIKVRGSLNPSDTTNKYVTQVYKKSGSDSVFYVKGGNHLWAFNDSTGSPGGGGGGKIYYLNGGVSMGTFGGFTMYELGDTANTGAAANFTRSTTGNIANFITDPNKPGLLQIPAGVWTIDAYLNETGGGSNSAEIYVAVEKWDGSTITTIATSPIEQITNGNVIDLYTWSVSIPTTALAVTDRIIIQFYIQNTNGKTVTLYTQNGYVGEVHTTFTTGIGAINGLTAPAQYLVTGTSGTDFNINSATATHTFNLPTASATNRGALSSNDWTTFNNKGSVSSVATNTGTGITGGTITTTGTLAIDTLLISTRAWRQKGIDSVASLVTSGYVPSSRTMTINGTTQDLSANRTWSVGTVTSVGTNTGTGITGGTITGAGTIAADTLLLSTRAWRQKGIDSVQANINGKVNISDTASMLTPYLRKVDTTSMLSPYLRSNVAAATYVPQSRTLTINDQSYDLSDNRSWTITAGIGGSGTTNYIPKWTSSSALGNSDLRTDASNNLGLGVTPSAWGSGYKAFDFNDLGGLAASGSTVFLQNNSYYNGTNFIRKAIGEASSYSQSGGAHIWQTAASGTTGSTISFSEVMRITSGGNVGIGTSSPRTVSGFTTLALNNATNGGLIDFLNNGTLVGQIFNNSTSFDIGSITSVPLVFRTGDGERMRITSGGNVGIGTTSPAVKLESNISGNGLPATSGTTQTNGALRLSSTATTGILDFGLNSANPWIQSTDRTDLSQTYNILLNPRGGNVGIGVTAPTGTGTPVLHINATTTSELHLTNNTTGTTLTDGFTIQQVGNDSYVWNYENSFLSLGTNNTERMRITSGGSVGIGTTSPNSILDITSSGNTTFTVNRTGGGASTIQFTNSGSLYSSIISNSSTGENRFSIGPSSGWGGYHTFYTDASERMRITSGGNVLIGTTTDNNALGTNVVLNGTSSGITAQYQGTTHGYFYAYSGGLSIESANSKTIYVLPNGANGVYISPGSTSWTSNSDLRLKNIIRPIESATDKLMTLNPVIFSWKSDTTNRENIGLIAQEVESVFPQIIDIQNDTLKTKGVRYTELIPILIQSIKELKAEIETLKK